MNVLRVALAALTPAAGLAALIGGTTGCDPEILVGANGSADAATPDAAVLEASVPADAGGDGAALTPLVVPWSTGFENQFVDWSVPANAGFCYFQPGNTFFTVTSPVHSGLHAAAFVVDLTTGPQAQTRCIRQGVLPTSGYYGAWYFIPASAFNTGNWNLLHFQGANVPDGNAAHGLLDVSLLNTPDGGLETAVHSFFGDAGYEPGPPIPIGVWFHLEVFLRRAAEATGQYTLYFNGQPVVDRTGVVTDDSLWGQWFVGDLVTSLAPPSVTVYVDDVTIGTTLSGM